MLHLIALLHVHIRASKWRQATRITPLHLWKKYSGMNVFMTNFRRIIRTEEPEKTPGQKFGLTAEEAEKKYKNIRTSYTRHLKKVKSVPSGSGREYRPNPKPMLSSMFSPSSSSQNSTEKQITSQKSSSSIDCRHFNFDLVGKKIPSASLFYRLIRYKRFNGNQGIARITSIASVVFHRGGCSFQATETILATGTTIWKPAFSERTIFPFR